MRYRSLGKTGFQVSEIGFGGWAIGGNAHGNSYGATDDVTSMAALHATYEAGCNFFDTADVYGHGHAEQLLGQALKHWKRDEVFIATAGGQSQEGRPNFSGDYIRRAVDASLKRLEVDAIDLYQLHTPPLELVQHGGIFETLRALKQEGKIRFYGIAIHDPQEGIQAIQVGQVDAVQAIYNLFDTRITKQLTGLCQQTQTALIIREPLARGFLSGEMSVSRTFESGDHRAIWPKPLIQKRVEAANSFKALIPEQYETLSQLAIAYALSQPAVSTVIPGCKTPQQAIQNMATGNLPPLSTETLEAIISLQGRL